jgi:FkbM family methyltransferase
LITARHKAKEIENTYCLKYPIMSFDQWFAIKNLECFGKIKAYFADNRSKDVLDLLLLAMLTGNKKEYFSQAYDDKQYFCLPNFINENKEVFVDVGAYVGDTLEKFIWNKIDGFNHIYCFEPEKKLFKSLQARCNRLINEWAIETHKITLENAGIGDKNDKANLTTSDGLLSSASFSNESIKQTTAEKIPIYAIDSYFKEIPVTFIKADIEGYEMKLLLGAKETIKRDKPKLALCTYHGANDVFAFIDYLSALVPEYKFALRHHSLSIFETVLYCFVEQEGY